MIKTNSDSTEQKRIRAVVASLWLIGWICIVVGVGVLFGWKVAIVSTGIVSVFHAVAIANVAKDET